MNSMTGRIRRMMVNSGKPAIWLGLAIAAPTAAVGGEAPSFDCAKAQSGAEKLVCSDSGLAELDRLVAERFAKAVAVAKGLGDNPARAEKTLRAEQRGWVKGRDECWKSDDQRACVEAEYGRREAELVTQYMLEEATGQATWVCGGNPANDVVTMFFDTRLPSVRFERGDRIDTGTLVESGSGSKYEGSFGRSIWIHGDSAIYRDPDPDGAEYECRIAN